MEKGKKRFNFAKNFGQALPGLEINRLGIVETDKQGYENQNNVLMS